MNIFMGRIVKCAYCGGSMDKDTALRYKDKNYHESCCQSAKERDKVSEYICYLFDLKAPGPQNYRLLKKYIEEEGYTYKGIFYSLKYFYEVKKSNITKGQERIGIVPYIYDEAQKYFKDLENKKEKIKDAVKPIDTINVTVTDKKNRNKKTINLEDLLGE